ncbi:MAG: hypothetical protein Q9225_005082 [Loekoesia sp. 1 TL-2023]
MAAKSAKAAFSGTHTAGIYADMTVDGPEIGTLVVVVDRAKNLPNRKSMGKQDPYCAARLGKEAKKTDTDKRGGQTPKWDQELRFTVHESPDYYQLKVSVFNDDKKTELIGETRIGLEDIIVPGGGQNDTWHNLHCKGRFAGEIRIEMTYYDTRPKEEHFPERQSESAVNDNQEPGRDSIGGPRGPKPLKRRPLPANPTGITRPGMPEHSHSSPLPQPTQQIIHQPTPSYPDRYGRKDHRLESTPPSGSRHQHAPYPNSIGPPMVHDGYDQQWTHGYQSSAQGYEHYPEGDDHAHNMASNIPAQHPNNYHEQYAPRPLPQDPQKPVGLDDPYMDSPQPRDHHTSLPHPHDYDHSFVEQPSYKPHNDIYSQSPPTMPHEDSMPDVRPFHISGSAGQQAQRHSLPNSRGFPERSSTQQHYPNGSYDLHTYGHSSVADDDVPPPPPAHRTNSGVPDTSHSTPPNMVRDPRSRHNQMSSEVSSQHQPAQAPPMQPRSHHAATIHSQSPLQAFERGPDRRPHRASAPVIHPQAGSPDLRIPARKSVSPQPDTSPDERRGPDVPFGPDSYDAFNPYVSSSNAALSPGARYDTPEQAKEASIQHERTKKLGDGPIIGSDGRVIDPSDHLPTDTWAPEPEVKAPKKTAQVNIRFRNSPQGAQPMPRSSPRVPHDSSARPASISTPTHNHNANSMPENISPVTAARARLQKKTRVSPTHPSSSPAVPTINTALQNPVLRSTASDYPLQEHENYGYGNSPTYNRPSPTGIPPPVPGKVPIAMGQEDWRRDPLSEELSRIDIGVGGGRMRRTRYGG